MLNLLVAIDGSDSSVKVTEHVIKRASRYREPLEVHLLNVQVPIVGVNVKLFIRLDDLDAFYREEGMAALKHAREKLDAAGIKYRYHIGVGNPAEVIVQYAEEEHCEEIVMGTRGLGAVSNLVLGSVATKVIHLAHVPVVLVK